MSDATAKTELRRRIRAATATIAASDRPDRSDRAAEKLAAEPAFAQARVVMVFLSMPDEIDTRPVIQRCRADGKIVLAPRTNWIERTMMPIDITDASTADLVEVRPGWFEPAGGSVVPIDAIDLVLVPGVAFTPAGDRLGRGGGVYDRFLARPAFRGVAIGYGFAEQCVDGLPVEPHDQKMTRVILG